MIRYIESFVRPFIRESPPELLQRCDDDLVNEKIDSGLDMDYLLDHVRLFKNREKTTREASRSLARLVIELEDQIPHYDTIISDDVSGRLVSLFLREVIKPTLWQAAGIMTKESMKQ